MNIEMKPVDSSQIHSVGYDYSSNTLAIRFKSKGQPAGLYQYPGVTPDLHSEFLAAESLGVFFAKNIRDPKDEDGKPLYPHTKIVEEPNAE